MKAEDVIKKALEDKTLREELAQGMRRTLLGWKPGRHRYERWNLLGERIATGQRTQQDMDRADESLREDGYTLTDAE